MTNKSLLCFCYYRQKNEPPLTKIEFVDCGIDPETGKAKQGQTKLKLLPYTFSGIKKRSLGYESRSILQRKFIPKVLSRYPVENRAYYPFDENVASFWLTHGIRFEKEEKKTKDEYQSPKFFSFVLTDHEGTRMFWSWMVFKECPIYPELAESLKAFNVTDPREFVVPKAICIVSHYSFISTFKEFLKSLYSIHFAKTPVPIERYVWNFVDEIPVPDKGNILVEYDIGSSSIPFYIPVDQYAPYASEKDIEYTFQCLGSDEVIIAVLQLSLEKKILLVSKFKSLLSSVSMTLVSLLFPFKWMHVYIPILPESMGAYLEWPFPFLMGIEKRFYDKSRDTVPEEVIVINLDNNEMKSYDNLPKMPPKEFRNLTARVRRVGATIFLTSTGKEREKELKTCEDAFLINMGILPSDMEIEKHKFEPLEIRDAFLEFFSVIMKNYQMYMISPNKTKGIVTDARDWFKFSSFRSHKDASKQDAYIYQLTWTTMFNTFIEVRAFGDLDEEEEIAFFDQAIKQKRKKKDPRVIKPPNPGKIVKAMAPFDLDIEGELWSYDYFPILNMVYYNKPRPIQNFIKDANNAIKWKVDNKEITKMNDSKWARFLLESVYVLWFYVMSVSLPKYESEAGKIFKFSQSVLTFVKSRLKSLKEIEFVYKKLFEACMKCKLHEEASLLRDEMKSITFAFLDTNQRTFIPTDGKAIKKADDEEEKKDENDDEFGNEAAEVSYIVENVVISAFTQCMNTTCNYLIREEEIMTGWQKSMNEYVSQCPKCKAKFVPQLTFFTDSDHDWLNNKEGEQVLWLPPSCLMKEFTNCISQKGENVIVKEDFRKDHKTIYWNLIFYFKLLKLPCFFLDHYYNASHIYRQSESLDPYMPVENRKKGSSKQQKLSLEALSKLNEANANDNLDADVKFSNRPPSMYEGVMGGKDSDSIGFDTLSQTNSVSKPRRPGSVANYPRSASKARGRGGSSQRSKSGSHVTSLSDLERIDNMMSVAPHANKNIVKYFGKFWEDFRKIMSIKNQDLLLTDMNFDNVPPELAKQISEVRKDKTNYGETTSEVGYKIPVEMGGTFSPEEIISGSRAFKTNSVFTKNVSKFNPSPPNFSKTNSTIAKESPMRVFKKSKLKIKQINRVQER